MNCDDGQELWLIESNFKLHSVQSTQQGQRFISHYGAGYVCFIVNCWACGGCRQLVGLLGRLIRPVPRPLPARDKTKVEEMRTDIDASNRIRTHDANFRTSKDFCTLDRAAIVIDINCYMDINIRHLWISEIGVGGGVFSGSQLSVVREQNSMCTCYFWTHIIVSIIEVNTDKATVIRRWLQSYRKLIIDVTLKLSSGPRESARQVCALNDLHSSTENAA